MDKKTRQYMLSRRDIVRYNANRAYFGRLTSANLSAAYKMFKHTEDWDKPVTSADVRIGKIDGAVICEALWHEMSYNPVRFGRVSPFMYKGREDIYHFCRNGVPEDFPGFQVIEKIRHKMIDFMMLNGRDRGCWYDVINAPRGTITIKFVDGHSDDNYKELSMLREMIKLVTDRNTEDFKHKEYRLPMLKVIDKRHPNGVRGNSVEVCPEIKLSDFPTIMMPEEIEEDRLDKAEENAQITADNRRYVPRNQYNQARADLVTFANIRTKENGK